MLWLYQVLCHLQTQDESRGTAQLSHKSAWRMSTELLTHNAGDISQVTSTDNLFPRLSHCPVFGHNHVHCLKCT